ncbi:MAG: hypothetical protein RL141_651 [Candidatus Parcubacteria bacterium]
MLRFFLLRLKYFFSSVESYLILELSKIITQTGKRLHIDCQNHQHRRLSSRKSHKNRRCVFLLRF